MNFEIAGFENDYFYHEDFSGHGILLEALRVP
jgi:hypothetical protein